MNRKFVEQILKELPRKPQYEEFFSIEEEIAARAKALVEKLDPTGLASVVTSIWGDYCSNVDRGFAEGDVPEDIANYELEMAVLGRVLKLLEKSGQ